MRIPLLPGLIFALISFVSNLITGTIIYLLRIPLPYIHFMQHTFSIMLAAFPQSVREFLKLYDVNGLRHNISHLNDNTVRKKIAVANIDAQINYVDRVTKRMYPIRPGQRKQFSSGASTAYRNLYRQSASILPLIPYEIDMTQINTTAIGNLAWMSLYDPDETVRNFHKEKLQDIKDYFSTLP